MTKKDGDEMLLISEAAKLFSISRQAIYRYIYIGLLEKVDKKVNKILLNNILKEMTIGRPSLNNEYCICNIHYLDVERYAKKKGTSIATVYRRIRNGSLQAIRINSKLFVDTDQSIQ